MSFSVCIRIPPLQCSAKSGAVGVINAVTVGTTVNSSFSHIASLQLVLQ